MSTTNPLPTLRPPLHGRAPARSVARATACLARSRVAHLLEDGSRDDAFGTGGLVVADLGAGEDDEIHGAVAVKGGKVAVCGRRGDAFAVAVLEADDGAFDPNFGGAGVATADFPGSSDPTARALAALGNGKLLVVGDRLEGDVLLAQYTKKGALDPKVGAKVAEPLGDTTEQQVRGVAVGKKGAIDVSGSALSPQRVAQVVQLSKLGEVEGGLSVDFGSDSAAAPIVRLKSGVGVVLMNGGGAVRLWGLLAKGGGSNGVETPVDFGVSSRGSSLAVDSKQRVLVTGASADGVGLARVLTR